MATAKKDPTVVNLTLASTLITFAKLGKMSEPKWDKLLRGAGLNGASTVESILRTDLDKFVKLVSENSTLDLGIQGIGFILNGRRLTFKRQQASLIKQADIESYSRGKRTTTGEIGLGRIPKGVKVTSVVLKDNTVGTVQLGKLIRGDENEWLEKLREVGLTEAEIKQDIPLSKLGVKRVAALVNAMADYGIKDFKVGDVEFIHRGKSLLVDTSKKAKKPVAPGLPAAKTTSRTVDDLKVTSALPHNDYNVVAAAQHVFDDKVNWKEVLKAAKVPVSKTLPQLTTKQFDAYLETLAANGIWAFSISRVVFIRGGKLTKHKVSRHERMLGLVNTKKAR